MSRQIVAAELSYENVPDRIRKKLTYNELTVRAHLLDLSTRLDEVFILSSRSRFAVYGVHQDVSPLIKFFSRDPELAPYVVYYTNTEETVHHLFATAGELSKSLKGDTSIVSQLRQAYQLGLESESVGLILDNLLRESIRVGERIAKERSAESTGISALQTGFSLLEECIQNVYNKIFLIIGSGKIASYALSSLHNHKAVNVFVMSHDDLLAFDLADKYNATAAPAREIKKFFSIADVIIRGEEDELFTEFIIDSDLNKKRIVLDFNAKDTFHSMLKIHRDVELYDIEDLTAMRTDSENFGGLGEAWEIVMEETQNFVGTLRHLEISPILAAYWNRIIDIKSRELDWMLPKLGDVRESDSNLVKKYTRNLIRPTAKHPDADPAEYIKQLHNLYNINFNISNN